MVQKNGLLPWRVEEMHGKLVRAFADIKAERPYAKDNIKFLSAVLAHYVGDAHVPFHAVVNYDGQLTNQHGLHSRFESQLFERYRSSLRIRPTPMRLSKPPREFIFDTLIVSASLVDPMLAADREAIGSGEVYDRAYYERFFAKARPTLERRLSEAIAGDRRRDHPCLGGRRQAVARRRAAPGPPEAPGDGDAVAAPAAAACAFRHDILQCDPDCRFVNPVPRGIFPGHTIRRGFARDLPTGRRCRGAARRLHYLWPASGCLRPLEP